MCFFSGLLWGDLICRVRYTIFSPIHSVFLVFYLPQADGGYMYSLKKVLCITSIFVMTVLAFTGCDLLSSLEKERSYPLQRNSIEVSKDTDLLILRSIFPEGLKETLEEQLEIASDERSRNYFRPSIYDWRFDTPDKAYGAASGIKRFPEGEGTYLTLNYEDDPTIEGRFFTMEPIDIGTKGCYRIVFTVKKKEGFSSLDRVESIYYVSSDEWTAYDSRKLVNEGWETERVYYRDGKVGDRTVIAT